MKKIALSLCPVVGITVFAVAAWVTVINVTPPVTVAMETDVMEAEAFLPGQPIEPAEEADHTDAGAEEVSQMQDHDMNFEKEDGYLLAKLAMAEAEGEDTEGKALVMLVVINRVRDDGFPDTVREVIYQSGQFSPVSDGDFEETEPDEDCWKALELVETGGWDKSMDATYFENAGENAWHRRHLKFLFQHGRHYFYREW